MKKIFLLLSLLFMIPLNAQNFEVRKIIETFFEGFHAKDSVKIKSVCDDKIILQSIKENIKGAKLTTELADEFYKSIATIANDVKFEEKFLSYSIQVDGTIAHLWTPYEFYINDKFSHKGVNAFTLFKKNDLWKIIHIIDTRRK